MGADSSWHVFQEAERSEKQRQAMAALREREQLVKLEQERKAREEERKAREEEEEEERRMKEEEQKVCLGIKVWLDR